MEQCRELWQHNKSELDSLEWPNWQDGTRVKYLPVGDQILRLQEINEEFVDTTWCDKEHTGFVVQGELEINFQLGGKRKFPEGSDLVILKGSKHKARSITPKVLLFLVEKELSMPSSQK